MLLSDLHWLAGLLEGEGCFRSVGKTPIIVLHMTDRDVMERAQRLMKAARLMPTTYRTRPTAKLAWRIAINGRNAAMWMMTLWLLMGERRRAKITECLKLWKTAAVWQRYQTHCKRGHEFNAANTYIYPGGSTRHNQRQCKACRIAREKAA